MPAEHSENQSDKPSSLREKLSPVQERELRKRLVQEGEDPEKAKDLQPITEPSAPGSQRETLNS